MKSIVNEELQKLTNISGHILISKLFGRNIIGDINRLISRLQTKTAASVAAVFV